jgi:hypothetical protein
MVQSMQYSRLLSMLGVHRQELVEHVCECVLFFEFGSDEKRTRKRTFNALIAGLHPVWHWTKGRQTFLQEL